MKNNDSTLHIRLNSDLRNELDLIAENRGEKLSTIIREALEDFADSTLSPVKTKILIDRL